MTRKGKENDVAQRQEGRVRRSWVLLQVQRLHELFGDCWRLIRCGRLCVILWEPGRGGLWNRGRVSGERALGNDINHQVPCIKYSYIKTSHDPSRDRLSPTATRYLRCAHLYFAPFLSIALPERLPIMLRKSFCIMEGANDSPSFSSKLL